MRVPGNPWVRLVLLLAVALSPAAAQEKPALPVDPVASPVPAALSYPSAPEIFDALAKRKNPRWRTLYRPSLGHTFPKRSTSAFWLGVHLSDLYLSVQARDVQRVSNLCRDLESFGRNLGVYDEMKKGVITLTGHSGKQEWTAARAEVEAMAQKFMRALRAQNDDDLATLVRAGEWTRILQLSTAVVDDEAFDDLSIAVGGHGLLSRLCSELERVEPGDDGGGDKVNALSEVFHSLCKRWERDGASKPSMEDVLATKKAIDELMNNFSSRAK